MNNVNKQHIRNLENKANGMMNDVSGILNILTELNNAKDKEIQSLKNNEVKYKKEVNRLNTMVASLQRQVKKL
jgi:prophage DNA circulation protein